MKVGRNDPCPCGSGEKYKKCCMAKDLAAKAAQPPAPAKTDAAAESADAEKATTNASAPKRPPPAQQPRPHTTAGAGRSGAPRRRAV